MDLFLDQICKLAEQERFSLEMLKEWLILLTNLARIYPEEFSSQFLQLLHAYTYFTQKNNQPSTGPSMERIRLFLEPIPGCPLPELDVTKALNINLALCGSLIEDAVRAFYTSPSKRTVAVIQNIFVANFDQAIVVLRDMIDETSEALTIQWVFYTVDKMIVFLSKSNQVVLLQVLKRTMKQVEFFFPQPQILVSTLHRTFWHLWRTGLLNDALQISEKVIKYHDSHLYTNKLLLLQDGAGLK
ncbi:hypothetical protein K438DRAFT_516528 [Mycena galopus ATCC 62051]|nr:hypothetical protein K438DRAFT_516528 [Mycena galopus ATCC 62051]